MDHTIGRVPDGPAGASVQKHTVLNNSLSDNDLPERKCERQNNVRYPCCSFRSLSGSKSDQKTHARNQNQVQGSATSFLAGETVGFCLNDVPFTTQTRLHFDVILPLWGRRGPR
jgi:hypothetical protein